MPDDNAEKLRTAQFPLWYIAGTLLVPIATYWLGYKFMPVSVMENPSYKSLAYSSPSITRFFYPAAWVDAKLTGRTITLTRPEGRPELIHP